MRFASVIFFGVAWIAVSVSARAQDQAATAQSETSAPTTAVSLPYDIKLTGHAELGTSINPDNPANNVNFGQTFTDQANTLRLNQAMLTLERDLDPKNSEYQWGFKLQGMYGTDSRVTHFYNEFDRTTKSPYQWDVVEADLQAHLPLFGGGTDIKLGQYPTPLGAEVIDATGNIFYSHTYIFNYGLPFKHTGLLTTTHVNDTLDVWAGIDTGVNNFVGQKGMPNNEFPKALVGFGLNNLMNGNLTILALAHLGPENPRFFESAAGPPVIVPGANSAMREYYDLVTTYKISDAWNTINEINVIHDDLARATGAGVAQYVTYIINDQWSISGRAEVFADQANPAAFRGAGFTGFVCDAQSSLDYTNSARGLLPSSLYCSGANVTYGALTIGATYKPSLTDKANIMVRPEARFDSVIGGGHVHPFDTGPNGVGRKTSQVTLAVDLIIGF